MTKRNLWIGIPIVVIAVFLLGLLGQALLNGWSGGPLGCCDTYERAVTSSGSSGMMQKSVGSTESDFMLYDSATIAPETPSAGLTAAEADQKIIKTGYLDLQVSDVAESVSKITTYANGTGGFVESSETQERQDGSRYGSVTVRVLSANFETAMSEISSYATLVQTQSSQGQDVTEQYTDLEARLKNAQAQEQEYLKILKQATSVEDILAVQQYLGQIRQEIESYQGQIKYLSNQTSYSTISVGLSEASNVHLPTKAFRPFDTLKDAVQGLGALVQRLVEGLIYLVIIGGGIALPIVGIIFGVRKFMRRRRQI